MTINRLFGLLARVGIVLTCVLIVSHTTASAVTKKKSLPKGETKLWTATERSRLGEMSPSLAEPEKYLTFRLDRRSLGDIIKTMPLEFSEDAREKSVILEVPTPDGKTERFRIEESPVLSPELARQFPTWKTFTGQGIDDPTAIARFDWTYTGFHGFVVGTGGSYFISPFADGNVRDYIVYYKQDFGDRDDSFYCKWDNTVRPVSDRIEEMPATTDFSYGQELRTLRIAIAATGEWTQSFANQTAALNDIVSGVNRQNLIYRRDFSVQFTLVSGTNLVYTDPNTDPYDNTDSTAQLAVNQTNIDNVIGSANYDIGHLVGTGGGGVASSPVVCENGFKARGYSARGTQRGDPFWVDYVSHEIGHQFGADHTYNTLEGSVCSTRSAQDAFEVASGVTIMSYVGICGARNLQRYSLDNFHIRSMTQIIDNLNNPQGGGQCPVTGPTGNSIPTVNPGGNFTIPRLTPFALTATGNDADGNGTLTYSWEQYDLAPSASGPNGTPAGTYDVDTDGIQRPLFRSFAPSTSPTRTFPSLTYILNNANVPPMTYTGTSPTGAVCQNGDECVNGENLPSVARTMNFRVVVRDNRAAGGGVVDAGMTVSVVNTPGPFRVTAPNTGVTWQGGSQQTVTWDVNGTDQAPISASNVNILLSTDGGQSFPITLVAGAANDGSQQITVPNNATTNARIKVQPVANVFFDISDADFTINASAPTGRRYFDFDGDGKTDISIFRPSLGQWWLNRSNAGLIVHTFGNANDILTPGDFTGDGSTDVAIFRPSTGAWFVLRSENFTFYSFPFGTNGDIPVPADYDGDSKADAAVFRPTDATWYIQRSTGGTAIEGFGLPGDRPVVGDYDGDGKDDIAIFRPSLGQWWLKRSTQGVIALTFGSSTDRNVQGDFTGDGKTDPAIWRPSTGQWFVLRSEDYSFYSFPFGSATDTPAPGDYDGDGRFDAAVFRPGDTTWYIQRSTAGTLIQQFGAATDVPVPNAFVR